MRKIAPLFGFALAMAATLPAASQPATGGDRQKLIGIWRLVSITADGKVNPLRGGKPTGYIFYTASGEMGAMIQPERAPIAMAGKEPSPQEAQVALKGYTAYFGTYRSTRRPRLSPITARAACTRLRSRCATPLPVRARRPAGARQPATKSALVWERIK